MMFFDRKRQGKRVFSAACFCVYAFLYVTLHETNHGRDIIGMKTKWWIWCLLMLVGGCVSESGQWLGRAEACMEADPLCAYQCLQQIDPAEHSLTDEQRARYALLQVQAMHKCRMPLADDSLINIAVAYYQRGDDRHALAKALLYKGLVCKQNGLAEQAAEAFAASERNFERVDDVQYKALLFDHYGMLLFKQAMYEEALKYFKLTRDYEMQGDSAHYVVSTYRRMAMVYDLLGDTDSARICYAEGLAYAEDNGVRSRNYYLLLQNYASFLTESSDYSEAERLLLQCVGQVADSAYAYTLFSSLATLYYEKREYEPAIDYAEKVLESQDSLTVCGGYLRLYRIYRDMGDLEVAMRYHDLYRHYDNDLSMRRRTAQVAAVPHRMENRLLREENRGWQQRQWKWMALVGVLLIVAWGFFRLVRRRHQEAQAQSQQQLSGMKKTLTETEQQLGETAVNLGGLKGVVTSQSNVINRLKEELQRTKEEHKEEIRNLKESIRALETEMRRLKDEDRALKRTESEQQQALKKLNWELKVKTDNLTKVEHQHAIDQQLNHYVMTVQDAVAVDMLMQLRYNQRELARYDIRPSEYLPLLKVLLAQENPALAERLENSGLERKKLTMCYLMALGLDDVEMMSRAACLSVNSVKAYRRECREVVEPPPTPPKGERSEE